MRQVSRLTAPNLGLAWREFDGQFRRARELAPSVHRWGESGASSPLWLNAIASGIAAGAGMGPFVHAPGDGTGSVCFGYNTASGCKRPACKYAHICRRCRAKHSAVVCSFRGPM